jgi:hypothetical protein
MTTWTPEMKAEAIAKNLAAILTFGVPMAVVDYGLTWRKTGANSRFGVRDMHHVKSYGLTVVAINHACQAWCIASALGQPRP